MKFSNQIIIDLPREEVFKKMEDPADFKFWQKGFISYRHLSGNHRKEGARAKLKYKMGKREIIMIETIMKKMVPSKLHISYEAKGVFNIQKNYFQEEEKTKTLWIADYEFRFSGFMRIMGFFMPGAFKKQSLTYMKDFKIFAENGTKQVEMEREVKLIWDFRGPNSRKIAEHHEIHLREFITNNNIPDHKITGIEELSELHSLAFWVIPESSIPLYRDILKPHRASVYNP